MLIKVTNYCSMGCSHCMESSTIKGEHMTADTFARALRFAQRTEGNAWRAGIPPLILLSGGECTEHPDIVKYVEAVIGLGWVPMLLTNGMWLADKDLRESLLRPEWKQLFVQVTHDPRFYPKDPPIVIDDSRITYIPSLTLLIPLGRAKRKPGLSAETGLPKRNAPSSFNLRSLTRSLRSFNEAVVMMRARAASGMSGHCSPSVADNGDVMAGETRDCFKIGTVDSTNEELTKALIEMKCNACGLVDNLSPAHKRAIGESTLFGANE